MSRKHYQATADAIRLNIENKYLRELFAKALISALKQDNPKFDSNRFLNVALGD